MSASSVRSATRHEISPAHNNYQFYRRIKGLSALLPLPLVRDRVNNWPWPLLLPPATNTNPSATPVPVRPLGYLRILILPPPPPTDRVPRHKIKWTTDWLNTSINPWSLINIYINSGSQVNYVWETFIKPVFYHWTIVAEYWNLFGSCGRRKNTSGGNPI